MIVKSTPVSLKIGKRDLEIAGTHHNLGFFYHFAQHRIRGSTRRGVACATKCEVVQPSFSNRDSRISAWRLIRKQCENNVSLC